MKRRARFGPVNTVTQGAHTITHCHSRPNTQGTRPKTDLDRPHVNQGSGYEQGCEAGSRCTERAHNNVFTGRLAAGQASGTLPRGQFSCESKTILTVKSINYSFNSLSGNTFVGRTDRKIRT